MFPVVSSQADRKDKVHSFLYVTGAGREIRTQEKRRHGISCDFLVEMKGNFDRHKNVIFS